MKRAEGKCAVGSERYGDPSSWLKHMSRYHGLIAQINEAW
jgi:hypothetical protein